MNNYYKFLITAILSLLAPMAQAHTGSHVDIMFTGFVAGLVHPLTGADHLIALVLVGFLMSRRKGSQLVMLTGIVLSLAVGALLGGLLGGQAWVEGAILLSIPAFFVMQWVNKSSQLKLTVLLVSLFMLTHGWAHGVVEMGAISLSFILGFLLTSAVVISMASLFAVALRSKKKLVAHA